MTRGKKMAFHDISSTPPIHELTQLIIKEDNYNPDAPSPNAMAVDPPEEHVVEPNGTVTDDVVIINPDTESDAALLANDCALPTNPRAACLPRRPASPPTDASQMMLCGSMFYFPW